MPFQASQPRTCDRWCIPSHCRASCRARDTLWSKRVTGYRVPTGYPRWKETRSQGFQNTLPTPCFGCPGRQASSFCKPAWPPGLSPQRHRELLRQHPDLIYAVPMPWIAGLTWNAPLGPPTASNPGSTHSPSVAPGLTPCNSRAVHRLPKRKPTSAIKTRPQI